MNDEQYRELCLKELRTFSDTLKSHTDTLPGDDPLRELSQGFDNLCPADTDSTHSHADIYEVGASLVGRLFTTYPELAPSFPRQLLWFFGGDCLHYMPDDEIALFTQLDELRQDADASGKVFNLADERAKLLKLQ